MGNRHVNEVGGTVVGVAGALAAAGPAATIGLYVGLSLAVALVVGAVEAWKVRDAWVPFLLLAMALGAILLIHRKVVLPGRGRRAAWRTTGVLALVLCLAIEVWTAGLGRFLGATIGFNPSTALVRATGLDLGLPILRAREHEDDVRECRIRKASGELFDGSTQRAFLAVTCSGILAKEDIARACKAFLAKQKTYRMWIERDACFAAGVPDPKA